MKKNLLLLTATLSTYAMGMERGHPAGAATSEHAASADHLILYQDVKNIPWVNPALSIKQRNLVLGTLLYGMKKVARGEKDFLGTTPELSHSWICCRFSKSFELSLELARTAYNVAAATGIKIADIGCGNGQLTMFLPYVSDGRKSLEIAAIDGVPLNIKSLREGTWAYITDTIGLPPKLDLKTMTKMIQDLPGTNYFGEKAFNTFDLNICLNVFHLMSRNEKDAALRHFYSLLKPGGKLIVSQTIMNTQFLVDSSKLQVPDGVYSYYYKVSHTGERIDPDMREFAFRPVLAEIAGDLSPNKDYLRDGNTFTALDHESLMARIKGLVAPATLTLTATTERISEASFSAQVAAAGFNVMSVTDAGFNDPSGTRFRDRYPLPYFAGTEIIVIAEKPRA